MTERPDRFYKYRSFEADKAKYVRAAIVDHEAFFDTPDHFNDPFDCLPRFEFDGTQTEIIRHYQMVIERLRPDLSAEDAKLLAAQMQREKSGPAESAEYAHQIATQYFEQALPRMPMFCVSATPRNILMWSHYADNHRGVCLEFDSASADFAKAARVRYELHRPALNPIKNFDTQFLSEDCVSVKSSDWMYEREWRVIHLGQTDGVRKLKPESLVGIVFGYRADNKTVDTVSEWIRQRGIPINIQRAHISRDSFEVDITPI